MNGFIFLTNVKVNVLVSSFCLPKRGPRTSGGNTMRDGYIVLKFLCLVDNIEPEISLIAVSSNNHCLR